MERVENAFVRSVAFALLLEMTGLSGDQIRP